MMQRFAIVWPLGWRVFRCENAGATPAEPGFFRHRTHGWLHVLVCIYSIMKKHIYIYIQSGLEREHTHIAKSRPNWGQCTIGLLGYSGFLIQHDICAGWAQWNDSCSIRSQAWATEGATEAATWRGSRGSEESSDRGHVGHVGYQWHQVFGFPRSVSVPGRNDGRQPAKLHSPGGSRGTTQRSEREARIFAAKMTGGFADYHILTFGPYFLDKTAGQSSTEF